MASYQIALAQGHADRRGIMGVNDRRRQWRGRASRCCARGSVGCATAAQHKQGGNGVARYRWGKQRAGARVRPHASQPDMFMDVGDGAVKVQPRRLPFACAATCGSRKWFGRQQEGVPNCRERFEPGAARRGITPRRQDRKTGGRSASEMSCCPAREADKRAAEGHAARGAKNASPQATQNYVCGVSQQARHPKQDRQRMGIESTCDAPGQVVRRCDAMESSASVQQCQAPVVPPVSAPVAAHKRVRYTRCRYDAGRQPRAITARGAVVQQSNSFRGTLFAARPRGRRRWKRRTVPQKVRCGAADAGGLPSRGWQRARSTTRVRRAGRCRLRV